MGGGPGEPAGGDPAGGNGGGRARQAALAACGLADNHIQARRWDDAIACLRDAVRLAPDLGEAHCNLGAVLNEAGRPDEAEAPLRRALALNPDHVQALGNLANALNAQGRPDEAEPYYRRALILAPHLAALHYNLGSALAAQGRPGEAEAALRQAIALQPGLAIAYNNLGLALLAQGRAVEAEEALRQALALAPPLAPTSATAANNLGNALRRQDRVAEAAAAYRQALDLQPGYVEALYNLGVALADQGHLAAGVRFLRQALDARPDYVEALGQLIWTRRRQCDWGTPGGDDPIEVLEDRALALVAAGRGGGLSPFLVLNLPASPAAQARQAADYAAHALTAPPLLPPPPAAPRTRDRLRLGYLSSDLYRHATAYLTVGVLEAHDRAVVDVAAYAWGRHDGSDIALRTRAAFDRVVEIGGLSLAEAAARIRADGVDVLIDLKGHTEDGRPAIMAARPAPVQVSWLGYPGPLGVDWADYVLADAVVLPRAEQPFYHERIVHLPHGYQPNDDRRALVAPARGRGGAGLPEDAFVFCCLNAPHKITRPLFTRWMRLLRALPDSVLWLLDPQAARGGDGAVEDGPASFLRAAAQNQGVAPSRLVFAPPVVTEAHVGRHALADLFLDTLPYTAHTAASDALWAGLPVLTCRGDTFAGRVAASLLTAAGLPELVTADLDAYEAMALRLAREPGLLADARARLAAARDPACPRPLFDTRAQARALERAYRHMWERQAQGLPPEGFTVT